MSFLKMKFVNLKLKTYHQLLLSFQLKMSKFLEYIILSSKVIWEGVNITEVISTSNEFTILMNEDQVDIALKVLKILNYFSFINQLLSKD